MLAALKKWNWKEAEEFFDICVTSPENYPAALQMEALKKLGFVQLISTSKVRYFLSISPHFQTAVVKIL